MSPWDVPNLPERVRALYIEGKSMSQIASAASKEFGVYVTRNAVVGKIHRMGWGRPGDAVKKMTNRQVSHTKPERIPTVAKAPRLKVEKPAKPSPPTPFTFKPVVLAPEETPAPVPLNPKAWEPLEGVAVAKDPPGRGFCKWPIGDPEEGGFGYCGARACVGKGDKVSPYCPSHYMRAYRAAPPKNLDLKTLERIAR